MATSEALLLDTHMWIWAALDERARASAEAWDAVESALAGQGVALSEISFWEVAIKSSIGKLDVGNAKEWLRRASKAPGIGVIHVDRDTLVDSALLDFKERDPADRILIATALKYDLRLVTADEPVLRYAEQNRKLAVLDARP